MENNNQKKLTFPQRNWLLLCILAAILSAMAVHFVQTAAQKENYRQSIESVHRDTSGRDTANQMSSPPGSTGAKKDSGAGKKGADSAKH